MSQSIKRVFETVYFKKPELWFPNCS
jgi:hypothetical protein